MSQLIWIKVWIVFVANLSIKNQINIDNCFIPPKMSFFIFFGNKTVYQRLGATQKNVFFARICCKFLAFLELFCRKNSENDYFDQHLECAAPKRWSKYTTYLDL